MIRTALIAWVLATGAVWEERNLSIYPAAQCAALWAGLSDYAQASTYVDENPKDIVRANAFRDVALQLAKAPPDEIDRYIAEQRQLMVSLLDALIYYHSRASLDVFERLTQTCAEHEETRSLI